MIGPIPLKESHMWPTYVAVLLAMEKQKAVTECPRFACFPPSSENKATDKLKQWPNSGRASDGVLPTGAGLEDKQYLGLLTMEKQNAVTEWP